MIEPTTLVAYQDFMHAKFLLNNETLDETMHLAHAALGIHGELAELFDAEDRNDYLLELGDVLSYVMYASALLTLDVTEWLTEDEIHSAEACAVTHGSGMKRRDKMQLTLVTAGKFSEIVKKKLYRGTPLARAASGSVLRALTRYLSVLAAARGITMHDVILANTMKVESRYPGPPSVPPKAR